MSIQNQKFIKRKVQWSSVNNKKNCLLKVDLSMIDLFTIVMKMAGRVCNGKDCGFGPDPAFTNGEARGKVGP